MTSTAERYGWGIVFAVLVAFAVPWFMWGDSRLAFGLPLWLWWHVAWMALATGVFWLFANRAWGLGILDVARPTDGDDRAVGTGSDEVTATDRDDAETAGHRGGGQ